MDDTRVRVTVTKPVNLAQLCTEVGSDSLRVSGSDDDMRTDVAKDVVVDGDDVTEATLAAALAAHVAVFPPPPQPLSTVVDAAATTDDKLTALLNALAARGIQ